MRLIPALAAIVLCASGTGCATAPAPQTATTPGIEVPLLRLAPSALDRTLALQQRLSFRHGERVQTVEAMVESDTQATRVVIHAQGQVALRLDWDGRTLDQQRSPFLPDAIDGDRVLNDLQLVFWPSEAIIAALPVGWTLTERNGQRDLLLGETLVASIHHPGELQASLQQHILGYRLDIVSAEVAP